MSQELTYGRVSMPLAADLTSACNRRNLSAELKREGSGGMSARSYGVGPMSTASADITIDTPVR